MGAYDRIREAFQYGYANKTDAYKERLLEWNKQPSIVRVEKPTNIPRARTLGYKSKKGYFVVRVRIRKGMRKRVSPRAGRKAKHAYLYKPADISHQVICEQRANRKHPNAEVLNSYYVGETGKYKYYEVIMVDPSSHTLSEREKRAVSRKGRTYRGLTSAGRKGRGLR